MTNSALGQTGKRTGLTGTALKLIALALMLLDHIHYFFEFTGAIPLFFTQLGRIAGWLFLFAALEGFTHTHSRGRYLLRIWLMGAGMGAVNYTLSMFLRRGDGFFPENNIFATLTVLVVMWQGIDLLRRRKWLPGFGLLLGPIALLFAFSFLPASIMPFAFIAEYTILPLPMMTEGGVFYFYGGLLLFLFHKRRKLQVALFVLFLLGTNLLLGIQHGVTAADWLSWYCEWMGIFAAPFILLYNGQRGRGLKNLFYLFYPAHVYILFAASFLLYNILH